jgi:Raf kinase inhibitor-like YbhB/YbcL family protein
MRRRIFLHCGIAAAGLVELLLSSCSSTGTDLSSPLPNKNMKIESVAFTNNSTIPSQYTCDGSNISPPLSWDEPPVGTKSLVLICDDPDAPGGTFVHWVLYDLPPTTRQLPEGIPAQPQVASAGIHGRNDFGRIGYGGPCPPDGTWRYHPAPQRLRLNRRSLDAF